MNAQAATIGHYSAAESTVALNEHELNAPVQEAASSGLCAEEAAAACNAKLMQLTARDLSAIVQSFPPCDQPDVCLVLAGASAFASFDGFNLLRAALPAGSTLYLPAPASLAASLVYLSNRKTCVGSDSLPVSSEYDPEMVVILEEPLLACLETDPELARRFFASTAPLILPLGFAGGFTMFNSSGPDEIRVQAAAILKEVRAVQAETHPVPGTERALRAVLQRASCNRLLSLADRLGIPGARERLEERLCTVAAPAQGESDCGEAILRSFNGSGGITPAALRAQLDRFPKELSPKILDLLTTASIHGHRGITCALRKMHKELLRCASDRGIKGENVVYPVPKPETSGSASSFHMMTWAFQQANGIPASQIRPFHEADKLAPDQMAVLLDDLAGSGQTLRMAYLHLRNSFGGEIAISALVATPQAALSMEFAFALDPRVRLLAHEQHGGVDNRVPVDQKPADIYGTSWIGGGGWAGTRLLCAFPWGTPDNNIALFDWVFAPHFTLNGRGCWEARHGEKPYEPVALEKLQAWARKEAVFELRRPLKDENFSPLFSLVHAAELANQLAETQPELASQMFARLDALERESLPMLDSQQKCVEKVLARGNAPGDELLWVFKGLFWPRRALSVIVNRHAELAPLRARFEELWTDLAAASIEKFPSYLDSIAGSFRPEIRPDNIHHRPIEEEIKAVRDSIKELLETGRDPERHLIREYAGFLRKIFAKVSEYAEERIKSSSNRELSQREREQLGTTVAVLKQYTYMLPFTSTSPEGAKLRRLTSQLSSLLPLGSGFSKGRELTTLPLTEHK